MLLADGEKRNPYFGSKFYDILGDVIKGSVNNLSFKEQLWLVQYKGSDLIPCLLGFFLHNQ